MSNNQTALDHLRDLTENQLGTGVFLIPNPESELFGDGIRMLIPGLTYEECIRRSVFTMDFKWVPESVMTYQQMQEPVSCGEPCSLFCEEPRCICNTFLRICVPR